MNVLTILYIKYFQAINECNIINNNCYLDEYGGSWLSRSFSFEKFNLKCFFKIKKVNQNENAIQNQNWNICLLQNDIDIEKQIKIEITNKI